MSDNPFQPPAQLPTQLPLAGLPQIDTESAGRQWGEVRVECDYLVVPSDVALISYCIKTNREIFPEDYVSKKMFWCPSWVLALLFINPLFLIIAYYAVRKRCRIQFGMSPEIHEMYRRRRFIKAIIFIGLLVSLVIATIFESFSLAGVLILLSFVSVLSFFVGNVPLRIVSYYDGEFWITGCSPEFLARYRSLQPQPEQWTSFDWE